MSDLIFSHAFVEQICYLHESKCGREKSDVSSPKYVSQWLLGALSNRDSHVAANFPIISKKMRDEPGPSFRRSGLWITIKAFLQLSLTITSGETHGKYFYKLIMLKFMAEMCKRLCDYGESSVNSVDTAIEMIAKVARRIDKLEHFPGVAVHNRLTEKVKAEVSRYIADVRRLVQKQHKKLHTKETKQLSPLKRTKFDEDVVHKLSTGFTQYLEQRKNDNYRIPVKDEAPEIKMEEDFDPAKQPDIHRIQELRNDDSDETLRVLCDAENWVLTYLGETQVMEDVKYLRGLATKYFGKAHHFYRNEPVGYSRMVLTILKIIKVSRP